MRLAGLALLGALAAGPAAAQGADPGLPTAADGYFEQLERVDAGVWVFRQPRFQVQPTGNVTIVEQADGYVLVDAGGSPGAGRRLVGAIRGLSAKPVKAVILTHWHGDHPQGLSEILKAWPDARTIATVQTRAHLSDPKTMNTPGRLDPAANAAFLEKVRGFEVFCRDNAGKAANPQVRAGWEAAARLFRQYVRDMDGAITVAPQEGFADRLELPDPQRPLEARFLGRANTDGDAVVWLSKQRILVTGDTVVSPIPYGFGSYPKDWLAVIGRLKAFPFRVLIPGHGRPQSGRAYLDRLGAAIRDIRSQVGRLAKDGATLADVQRQVDASAQAKAFIGDDPWLRQWFQSYWVSAIVTSAYKEARGEPIVQSL